MSTNVKGKGKEKGDVFDFMTFAFRGKGKKGQAGKVDQSLKTHRCLPETSVCEHGIQPWAGKVRDLGKIKAIAYLSGSPIYLKAVEFAYLGTGEGGWEPAYRLIIFA